ncbi:MAG: hypothetical protein ABSG43_00870, partial [Solirubrobacteraceae bacterium]
HGNTRLIAQAIAEGLGCAPALAVHEAGDRVLQARLVVVGGATYIHGLAAKGARGAPTAPDRPAEEEELPVAGAPGLREWLRQLPRASGTYGAAFDTRLDKPRWLTGDAAHSIARRLANRGYEVLAVQSFLLQDPEGPLRDGEHDRARAFGERLAQSVSLRPTTRGAPTRVDRVRTAAAARPARRPRRIG